MTYKSFLNKLKWDTSLEDMRKYLTGENHLPVAVKKYRSQLVKDIKRLITKQEKDNEQWSKEFTSSPLFKLAFHKLGYTEYRGRLDEDRIYGSLYRTAKIMKQIVDKVDYSKAKGGTNLQEMLKEYCEK